MPLASPPNKQPWTPRDYITTVGAIIAITWGCIQIYNWLIAPQQRLTAAVFSGPYLESPSSYRQLQALKPLLSAEQSRTILDLKPDKDSDSNHQFALNNLSRYILDKAPGAVRSSGLPHGGYLKIDISNRGTKVANAVKVTIPDAGDDIFLQKPDGTSILVSGKGLLSRTTVDVGTMQPREKATVFSWTLGELPPGILAEVYLTHDSGHGGVDVYTLTATSPELFVVKHRTLFTLVFSISSIVLLFVFLLQVYRRR